MAEGWEQVCWSEHDTSRDIPHSRSAGCVKFVKTFAVQLNMCSVFRNTADETPGRAFLHEIDSCTDLGRLVVKELLEG